MDDIRTRGWLVARLELAVAVAAVLVAAVILLTNDPYVVDGYGGGRWEPAFRVWAAVFPYVGEALAIVGLAWMVRIWRGPTRDTSPEWRYRE